MPRRVQRAVQAALMDTRVVLLIGARQAGKSTLARQIRQLRDAEWRNLDRAAHRQAAIRDPTGFVDTPGPMVIDEVQRVPELILAIKERVDEDARPGQFLLTGSARVLSLRSVPDALPGRMETVELWPFSQGELDDAPDGFIEAVFRHGPELRHVSQVRRVDYVNRLLRGGLPEAVARTEQHRRDRYLASYLADMINREVRQLSEIEHVASMRALIRLLAGRSGQLVVPAALGKSLDLSADTVRRYLGLLEEIFLVKRVPAWSRGISTRAIGTPKVAFVDAGLAAHMVGADAASLLRPGGFLGPLMEGFVLAELSRQLTWSAGYVELFHYRTKDKVEVDAVLENRRGDVVGLEVKAASTVRDEDFRGLRHLAGRVGDSMVAGIVLYTGESTLSFGPKLRAMPIAAIWEAGVREEPLDDTEHLLRRPANARHLRASIAEARTGRAEEHELLDADDE